jgi:hypothetical protein
VEVAVIVAGVMVTVTETVAPVMVVVEVEV